MPRRRDGGRPAKTRDPDLTLLAEQYERVRRQSMAVAAPLSPEDCALQSMPDASPAKWHLAHTTWFFETFVLEPNEPSFAPFHPGYRFLFNSYYEAVGSRYPRPQRGLLSRPSLDEVYAYRAAIDERVDRLLPALDARALGVLEVGCHHEQQHQELLLTDLKHLFSRNPLDPVYVARDPLAPQPVAPLHWEAYDAGTRWIGHAGPDFAFDNERPAHRIFAEPFELASRLVTNGEYIEFIEDGGYGRPELWLSDGWTRVQEQGWRSPLYWRPNGRDGAEGFSTLTLSGRRPIEPSEPVCHVSYFEADAFARWADARLPTEAEWETVAGDRKVDGHFVESGAFHPRPAQPYALAVAPAQLFGDVWEWTQTAYGPYPGFVPESGALGEYNGKFMSGQMVLRGGSCATPSDHIRATYRNFFYPDARWQFSGIRLARSR